MTDTEASTIRVLLVEDHTVFRQALALAFGMEPELEVVGQAGSVAEAREMLDGIDVAVFDLDLPDGNGASLIQELHDRNRRAEALVLTASTRQIDHARAVEAGAADALTRAAEGADVDAVRALYEQTGAFARARELETRLRERCLELAGDARPEALGELLRFIVRTVLRERRATVGGG